jgi:hypothetical protein
MFEAETPLIAAGLWERSGALLPIIPDLPLV